MYGESGDEVSNEGGGGGGGGQRNKSVDLAAGSPAELIKNWPFQSLLDIFSWIIVMEETNMITGVCCLNKQNFNLNFKLLPAWEAASK